MMTLLDTDGAWMAIGISVLFIIVGLVMKRVFINILKKSGATVAPHSSETPKND